MSRAILLCCSIGAALATSSGALAQDGPLTVSGSYKGDLMAYDGGTDRRGTAALDLLAVVIDTDLAGLSPGLVSRLQVQNTSGDAPNTELGTVRGFNNSEVNRPRLRLYEAWVQQEVLDGAGSILVGYFDINNEFNVTDSALLFLGPAFGISTEFSSATADGPSTFPSTGLGARGRLQLGANGYLQGAVINARTGVPGDAQGLRTDFNEGVLLAAEVGGDWRGARLSLGGWRYSKPLVDTLSASPDDHTQGVYVMAERVLGGEGSPVTGFLRAGVSDGVTGFFSGGLQAGVNVTPAFASRPDSAFGIGVDYVGLAGPYRDARSAEGLATSRGETGIEITYADRLTDHVLIQPDLQFVFDPEGDPGRSVASVLTVRLTVEF